MPCTLRHRFQVHTRRPLCFLTVCLLGLPLTGCSEEEEIRRYQVDKPHVLQKINPGAAREDGQAATPAVPGRMLAAMVPHGEKAWFFKLVGPVEAVDKHASAFGALLSSIRFPAGADANPQWTTPEGWQQLPGNQMRFATLQIPASPEPLEVTISALPFQEGDEYVVENINRWRGQMQLPRISKEELAETTKQIEVEGHTVTVVDLKGQYSAGSGMQAPFASKGRPPMAPPQSAPADPGFTFKAPEGWLPGKSGGFRKAAFNIMGEEGVGEVTVIDLGGRSGDLLSNVNRWRGQVGLEPIKQEEVDQQVTPIAAGDVKGQYIEIVGSEDASPRQSILAAILPHGDVTTFVKYQGDAKLAERERERFQQFVRSIEFTKE